MDFPSNFDVKVDTGVNTGADSGVDAGNFDQDFAANDIATHNNATQTFGGSQTHGNKGGFHGNKGGFGLFKKGELTLEDEAVQQAVNDILDYQETSNEQSEEIELETDNIVEDKLKGSQVDKSDIEIDSSTDKG